MARASRRTPTTAMLRTGAPATAALPPALPTGAGGQLIKVENWGENNLLPQEILRVLYDSGTAETCTDVLAMFIGGEGFASEATAKAMANPLQTYNDLLADAKEYAAAGLGVAYIIRYNFGGEPAQVYVAPVDCLRREKDGPRFVVNPKLILGKMPNAENQVYLPYDPLATAEEIAGQVLEAAGSEFGYWGHLVHAFPKKVGRGLYPVPGWWSAKEAVEADAEAPKYDLKQFKNGFYPDAIMTMVGQKYADVEQENWTAPKDNPSELPPMVKSPDRTQLENNLKALKGSQSEASIMLNTVDSETEKPQIDWVDKGPNSKGLTDATNRIEGRVYRRMGVPPVLCGVSEPGVLGSNQQIVNSIKLFSLVVKPRRALCTAPLAQLFPALDFTVKPLNPVTYIDPAVADKMTDDELRAIEDLPALENDLPEATIKLVAQLNGLPADLRAKVLSTLSVDELRNLVPALPATPKPVPTPKAK